MLAELSHSVQSVWDRGDFMGKRIGNEPLPYSTAWKAYFYVYDRVKPSSCHFFFSFIHPTGHSSSIMPAIPCSKKTAFPLSVLRSARASLVLHRSHHTRLADTVHPSAIIGPGGARGGVGAP